jgi:hypothetical protein
MGSDMYPAAISSICLIFLGVMAKYSAGKDGWSSARLGACSAFMQNQLQIQLLYQQKIDYGCNQSSGETDELDQKFEVPAGNTQTEKINKPEPGDDPDSELI